MDGASFARNDRRPAWPMPARYAEIMSRLRGPIFASLPRASAEPSAGVVGSWFARLRLRLCPCLAGTRGE